MKYLNEAIDKGSRSEAKGQQQLRHSRYVLLKNEENLADKQTLKFAATQAANFEVTHAWQTRENFEDAFENATTEQSEAIFVQWHQAVIKNGIKK